MMTAPGCTGQNPTYAKDAAFCSLGGRQCLDSPEGVTFPIVCALNPTTEELEITQDRCQINAACQDGRCVAPPGATACQRQQDCGTGQVCVPLTVNRQGTWQIATYCVLTDSTQALPGTACSDDDQCQSFLCLQNAVSRYCLQACQATSDCPIPQQCRTFNVTVTGVQGTILSCSSG